MATAKSRHHPHRWPLAPVELVSVDHHLLQLNLTPAVEVSSTAAPIATTRSETTRAEPHLLTAIIVNV